MVPYLLMLLYLIAITSIFYCTKVFRHKKFLFCILLILPLIFLCSFKNLSVGNDTEGYYSYYKFYASNPLGTKHGEVEKGFGLYAGLFGHLKIPFSLFLFISYIIVFTPIILLMNRYANRPEMVAFSLFLFQFFNFVISGLRQSIAIGICLIGFYVLIVNWNKRKLFGKILKFVFYMLCFVISYFFHKSILIFAITGFVFFFFDILKINFISLAFVCLLAAFVSPYIYGMIFTLIQNVYHYDPPSSGLFIKIGFSTIIIIGIMFVNELTKKEIVLEKTTKFSNKFFNKLKSGKRLEAIRGNMDSNIALPYERCYDEMFAFILSISAILMCLFNSAEVFSRTIICFEFSLGFVLSTILNRIQSKKLCFIIEAGFILLLFVYFYFSAYRGGYLNIFPYRFGFYS